MPGSHLSVKSLLTPGRAINTCLISLPHIFDFVHFTPRQRTGLPRFPVPFMHKHGINLVINNDRPWYSDNLLKFHFLVVSPEVRESSLLDALIELHT